MPYKKLFLGKSVFLFYRGTGEVVRVVRAEWLPGYPPDADPKAIDETWFDSEEELEVSLMSKLFGVEVTQ